MPPLLLVALLALWGSLLFGPDVPYSLPVALGVTLTGALASLARPGSLPAAAVLALGVGAAAASSPPLTPALHDVCGSRDVQAVAASEPLPFRGGCTLPVVRIQVRVGRRRATVPGPQPLILAGPCPALSRGTRLQVHARLSRVHHDPHRIRLRAQAAGLARIGRVRLPAGWLTRARHGALSRIAPWRSPARAVLAAVLVGDRRWLPARQRARFRQSGTAHLLAISGLHVALVTALLLVGIRWGARRCPALVARIPAQRLAAVVALGGTWAFVLWSGAGPPAVRAGWMATAWLLALLTGRRPDAFAALGLAALFVTLWDPAQWRAPGCQLSFAAVTGLLVAGRTHRPAPDLAPASNAGSDRARRPGRLRSLGRATAVATLSTAPLAALHFGQVTAAGLVVNLLAVPILALGVVPVGLMGLAVAGLAPALGAPVLAAAAGLADALLLTIDQGARWLAPLAGHLALTPFQTVAAYGVLVGLWRGRARAGRWLAGLALGALLLARAVAAVGPAGGTALQVTFLDVGDGDAILITLPDGRNALVDAPGRGRSDASARWLVRRLRRRGVRRLAFVVATHPHADHVGGLPAVLEAFPVGVLYASGQVSQRPEWRATRHAARRRGVPIRRPRDQRLGPVRLQWLAPRRGSRIAPDPLRSPNDNSLVLRLSHPAGSVLLTGDLERPGEAALLAREPYPRATVLKAGHHGRRSATSRALLAAVRPRLVVISAEAPVRGVPSTLAAVRHRLARARIPLRITGRDGDVSLRIAPWGITVTAPHAPTRRWPPDRAPFPGPAPLHVPAPGAPASLIGLLDR